MPDKRGCVYRGTAFAKQLLFLMMNLKMNYGSFTQYIIDSSHIGQELSGFVPFHYGD